MVVHEVSVERLVVGKVHLADAALGHTLVGRLQVHGHVVAVGRLRLQHLAALGALQDHLVPQVLPGRHQLVQGAHLLVLLRGGLLVAVEEGPGGRGGAGVGLLAAPLHGKVQGFGRVVHAVGLIHAVGGQVQRGGGGDGGVEAVDEALALAGGGEHRLAAGAQDERPHGNGGGHVAQGRGAVHLIILLTVVVVAIQEVLRGLRARAGVGVGASLLDGDALQQVLVAAAAVLGLGVVPLLQQDVHAWRGVQLVPRVRAVLLLPMLVQRFLPLVHISTLGTTKLG